MATQTKTKKKTAAPPKTLNVAFVWDMSGSMAAIFDSTREGTNGYIMDLITEEKKLVKKHGEGTYTRLSLTAFDTVFEQWLVDEPIANVVVGSIIERYQPRGWTALYDAIANTITTLDSSSAGRKNEKFLVIVMTDGMENASKEYALEQGGKERLNKLVKAYEKKGNWTFVYLGANVDAPVEAAAIGIPVGNAAYYAASAGSVKGMSAGLSNVTATRRYAASASSDTSFQDAAETQDYRDENDKLWTPGKKK